MKAFQEIADANPGPADGHPSRNSGEPGYKASADYVAKAMKGRIQRHLQQYTFTYYVLQSEPPRLSESRRPREDFTSAPTGTRGSTGTAPAPGRAGRRHRHPPTPTPSSASG